MSCSRNSFKGGSYEGLYRGWGTRSLDYIAHGKPWIHGLLGRLELWIWRLQFTQGLVCTFFLVCYGCLGS